MSDEPVAVSADEVADLVRRLYGRLIHETDADLIVWTRPLDKEYETNWNGAVVHITLQSIFLDDVRVGVRPEDIVKSCDEWFVRERQRKVKRENDKANALAAKKIRTVLKLPPADTPVDRIVRELDSIIEENLDSPAHSDH